MRKEPVEITRDKDLDRGVFVIVTKDGEVKIETKDIPKDNINQLLEAIFNTGKYITVEAAKALIEKFIPKKPSEGGSEVPATGSS